MKTERIRFGYAGRSPGAAGSLRLVALLLTVMALDPRPGTAAAADARVSEAEAFVDRLQSLEFDRCVAMFDDTMREKLPASQLGAVWATLPLRHGAFVGRRGSRIESLPPYQIVLVTCEFERAWLDAKVAFDTAGRIAGLFFLPARRPDQQVPPYADTNRFEEIEVTFGDSQWPLPATLALPRQPRPAPAAILVHGSGPNDRDETIGANRPFRDLAWGLASRGVAVLRYEKRTKAHRTRLVAHPDLIRTVREEVTEDAAHALRWLRVHSAVDSNRIVLVGHSLGGMLAPRIARETPGWAAIVVLAGSTRPLAEVMVEQMEYLATLPGPGAADVQSQLPTVRRQAERVAALTVADADDPTLLLGAPASYWLDLARYDAPAVAAGLELPIWIGHAGRDYQVTAKDLAGWRRALANRPQARIHEYPDLNHLFIAGTGRSQPAEYAMPGFVATEVVTDLARWINELPGRPAASSAVPAASGESRPPAALR